jgi:DNA-binding MarR family transcriptional regulator
MLARLLHTSSIRMTQAPSRREATQNLFLHVQTLNELAVFLWLARRRESAFGASVIAHGVGLDAAVAHRVLEQLTEAGLVETHRSTSTLFRYALAQAPPENLVQRLCAKYRNE